MSRRSEFSKAVRGQRYVFAKGHCEACGTDLVGRRAEYDHHIADGAGGKPTFENCRLLCEGCHSKKTATHDIPLVAKVKRQSALAAGIKDAPAKPIKSAPLPQGGARKKNPIDLPPRRSLYEDRA